MGKDGNKEKRRKKIINKTDRNHHRQLTPMGRQPQTFDLDVN